jgi:hypothetical protein
LSFFFPSLPSGEKVSKSFAFRRVSHLNAGVVTEAASMAAAAAATAAGARRCCCSSSLEDEDTEA